jgi:hypothetical protein
MVGIVGVAKSKQIKLPIFMSYNPFLQTNRITPKANPSLLMLTISKSNVKNNFFALIFLYCIFLYNQTSFVVESFSCAQFNSLHFVALGRHIF